MELAFLESKTIIDSGTEIAKIGTNIKKSVSHDETKNKTGNKCGQCGRSHGKFCPARNWTCYLCFKKGHAKNMCPNNTKICSVDEEGDFFESLSFLNSVHNVNSKSEIVQLLINNVPVDMEIDTGAAVTVISSAVFNKKFPDLSLTRVSKQYTVANGETLDVVGKVLVSVQFGSKKVKLEMFIFRGAYKMPLFGRPWLDQLMPSWRDRFREMMCGVGVQFLSEDSDVTPMVELKKEYPLVFSEEPTAMKGFKATIVLKEGAKPIFCKPYSVPYAIKPMVEVELKKMVETGVLVPVKHSNWASPIVVVPKKDKSLRICVDFKVSVNKWVDFHHYPLPNIDDILASLSGCSCFTVLDLAGAYQQVEIAEDSMELFTINTHLGLFRFTRLTYGISSAPTIFQQLMDEILRGLSKTMCYLDDILVAGVDLEECRANVKAVFERLVRYNVHVNRNKCVFFRRKVEYLGHVIGGDGITPSPAKIVAIRNAPIPSNVTQLKAFLGLVNFYRKFMPMMASELAPLYSLTQKDVRFVWTRSCNDAFLKCKTELGTNQLLCHYDPKKELYLSCDASSVGVGAVLSQLVDGLDRPLMFASASLSPAEKNYSQLDKEALAIIFGVRKFHKFLFGRSFILVTDHQPLVSLFDIKKGIPITAAHRLQRWAIILSGYNYSIKYRKGKDMVVPDALSRLPQEDERSGDPLICVVNAFSEVDEIPICYEDVARETKSDVILTKVMSNVKKGWPVSTTDSTMSPFFVRKHELTHEAGCVVWGSRIIIPLSLRGYVLNLLHEDHPGVVRMKMLARSLCWWPKIDEEISKTVSSCGICQKYQRAKHDDFKEASWPKSDQVWYRIHADFFHFGGKTLLLIIDSTSKWVDVEIMGGTTAADVIGKFEKLFAVFGFPNELVTDNGPPFNSAEFVKFCQRNGISPLKSPAYVPQANGLAERAVQSVKRSLVKSIGEERRCSSGELQKALLNVLFSFRNTPNVVNSETPASCMLKFEPRTRLSQLRPRFGSAPVKGIPNSYNINLSKPFAENDKVYFRLNTNFNWEPGVVVKVLGLRRYVVKMGEQIRVLHQSQIRSRESEVDITNKPTDKMPENLGYPIVQPTTEESLPSCSKSEPNKSTVPATLPPVDIRVETEPEKIITPDPLRRSSREKKML